MSRPAVPKLPKQLPAPAAVLIVLIALVIYLVQQFESDAILRPAPEAPDEGYLFCVWNVENLFDDEDDPRNNDPLDDWFARDPDALRQKHRLLVEALFRLNDGRGPDILALVEVENRRAVELLRDALNARLPTEWQYDEIVHEDNITGRRIEPAVLTRLPVRHDRTRTFKNARTIEAHLEVEGQPLVVLASHWTSRVTDRTGARRLSYAQEIYEAYLKVEHNDPERLADVLIAGDFNDEPDDDSLFLGLRATGDIAAVETEAWTDRPRLLNLLAGRDPNAFGTYRYRNQWQILDHIVVSAGLLERSGWSVVPDSLRVVNDPALRAGVDRAPQRFGNEANPNPRGPSDHFAVTVRLKVHSPESEPLAWRTLTGLVAGSVVVLGIGWYRFA